MARCPRRARYLALLALAAAGGCASAGGPGAAREVDQPQVARVSLFSYPWVWTDEQGQSVTFAQWRGQPLVVSAVFTTCKATCPRTIAKLEELDAAFRREGRTVQFLLVTLDPNNDTPQVLRAFKKSSGLPGEWRFLTGEEHQTRELIDALDIHTLDDGPHLLHEGRIVIFDGNGMPTRTYGGWGLGHMTTLAGGG
jgi:protein SCO1/2